MKKLYLFLMAMIVAVTAGAADWYLVGASFELPTGKFSGKWADDAKCMFTPSADDANIQTLDFISIDGEFKIKEAGTWDTSMSVNGSNSAIEAGVVYNAGTNGGNIPVDGSLKNGTITIDTAKRTILISGESQGNEYTTVYIVGDIDGSGWNEALTTYPLSLKEGTENEWTGTYEIGKTSYLKFRAGNNVYGTGGADIAIEPGTTYTVSMSGNAFSIGKGKYDFTYVLDYNAPTGRLTVTASGEEPPVGEYPELYVRGAFNNNVADATSLMTETDGVYTITLDKLTGNFKIADGEWIEQYSTKNASMALGTAYDMLDASGMGGDMAIEGAATDVTLTFNYKEMTLKIEGTPYEPVVGYKINSDLSVTTWSMVEMTEADGLYTYTVTPIQAEGQMQIVKTLDGTATDYLGSEATISEENNEVTVSAVAGNLKYSLTAGEAYTFTYDPTTSKLSVVKATVPPAPEYPVLYVRGAFNNNVADETSLMTETDGIYTIALSKLTGNFKIADEEWTVQYSTKNTAMALGTAYDMLDASGLGGDMAIEGAATDVTLSFDYKAMTLKIEGTSYEPAVGYKINSDLSVATWSMVEMTEAEGLYEYTVTPAQAEGQMQIVKTVDGVASEYLGNGEATISEENNEVAVAAGSGNLKYSLSTESAYKFTFNPETGKLSVTAVEVVPPVAELPEHLYIIGNVNGNGWNTATPVEMTREGNTFVASNVMLDNAGEDVSYISFVTMTGADWDVINSGDRYGAAAVNAPLAVGETAEMKLFAAGVDASSAYSWKLAYTADGVDIVADFEKMTVSIFTSAGVGTIGAAKNIKVAGGMLIVEGAEQVAVYSTDGALVSRAAETQLPAGIYIVVVDGAAAKVLVK